MFIGGPSSSARGRTSLPSGSERAQRHGGSDSGAARIPPSRKPAPWPATVGTETDEFRREAVKCPSWVKDGKTPIEDMFSGLPQIADIPSRSRGRLRIQPAGQYRPMLWIAAIHSSPMIAGTAWSSRRAWTASIVARRCADRFCRLTLWRSQPETLYIRACSYPTMRSDSLPIDTVSRGRVHIWKRAAQQRYERVE